MGIKTRHKQFIRSICIAVIDATWHLFGQKDEDPVCTCIHVWRLAQMWQKMRLIGGQYVHLHYLMNFLEFIKRTLATRSERMAVPNCMPSNNARHDSRQVHGQVWMLVVRTSFQWASLEDTFVWGSPIQSFSRSLSHIAAIGSRQLEDGFCNLDCLHRG